MAGVRIDDLPTTVLPSQDHEFPAMKDGVSVRLKVGQVSALIEGILGLEITKCLRYVRALGPAEDLNTIKEPGIYTQNQNAGASGGSNYPQPTAGMLVVLPGGASTNVRTVQLYFSRVSTPALRWRMESAADEWYGWASAFDWDVPVVSQAVAEAGVSSNANVKWSPLRVAQAIAALSPGLGIAQTWQDVTASRAINTVYQNTTGKPIQVNIQLSTGVNPIQVSADGSTWVTAASGSSGNYQTNSVIVVPPGHYYRITGGTLFLWTELR